MYTIQLQLKDSILYFSYIYNIIIEKQHFPVKKTTLKINDLKVFKKKFFH